MSAGRRNSDGSWSLASDELEDLEYLVPSNAPVEHELTIRVMTFEDGAASTLKVLQHPIRLEEIPDPAGNDDAVCRSNEAHDPVLRSQLGEMQSLFAVRESELVELRAAVQQAKSESAAELQKARTAWEQDLNQRLAEVLARAELEKTKDSGTKQAEQNSQQLAKAEARAEQKFAAEHKRWQAETEQRIETERQKWLAEAERRAHAERERWVLQAAQQIESEHKRWQAETEQRVETERRKWQAQADQHATGEQDRWTSHTDEQIAAERNRWQAETEQRVGAERQHWQAEAAQRIEAERQKWQVEAEQRARAERDRLRAESAQHLETERRRWQAETAQCLESERQALAPQADQRLAAERERWQAEAKHRLESEYQRWQAEAEQRAAKERQDWQAQADQQIAAERERRQAEARHQLEREHQRWQAEAEQRAAKERQAWQAQADQRLEHERKRHETDSLGALKRAEENWKAQEAARAATASAEWQQLSARMLLDEKGKSSKLEVSLAVQADKSRKLEAALAQALAQAKSAPASGAAEPALERLGEELAGVKAALAERETDLVRIQAEREQERTRWQQELQASLEAKTAVWKAEEAVRQKAMAEVRAQSEGALVQMTARCESAEQALTDIRSRKATSHEDDGYIESLRSEVAELRSALVKSETELGWARSALDQAQPLHIRRAAENLPIGMSIPREQEEGVETTNGKRGLVRDFLIVVAVAVPVILFYPWFAGYLPEEMRSGLATVTGGVLSAGDPRATVPVAATPAPAPVAEHPAIIVSRSVNVRTTPATKGAVLLTLPKGGSLIVLEQSGNWTHVEIPAKDAAAKAQQGWVFSANLSAKKESAREDVKDSADSSVKTDAAPVSAVPEAAKSVAPPAVEPVAADHSQAPPANPAPPASNPPETAPAAASSAQ
jgi:hypothetical protein